MNSPRSREAGNPLKLLEKGTIDGSSGHGLVGESGQPIRLEGAKHPLADQRLLAFADSRTDETVTGHAEWPQGVGTVCRHFQ